MAGIKETKDAIALIQALADAIKSAKQDGVINWMDLPSFIPVISAAQSALDKSDLIPSELSDLNADEIADLLSTLSSAVLALVNSLISK